MYSWVGLCWVEVAGVRLLQSDVLTTQFEIRVANVRREALDVIIHLLGSVVQSRNRVTVRRGQSRDVTILLSRSRGWAGLNVLIVLHLLLRVDRRCGVS